MLMIQRRKEARVNVEIPTSIKKIILNKSEICPNKVFPAYIINLSAGGVLLKSPLSVPVNLKFIFELTDEKMKILCYLEILRKEERDDFCYYGCRLKTVFQSDIDKMRVLVLRKQIQNLKCTTGNEGESQIISGI